MEIDVLSDGTQHCVRLTGVLDSQGAARIYDELVSLALRASAPVILEMSAVSDATRAGCGLIFTVARLLHRRPNAKLSIVGADPSALAILIGSGRDHLIAVQTSHAAFVSQAA
ncbi:MAG: STAS domain-containing protein [Pseudomonadota bacterium]